MTLVRCLRGRRNPLRNPWAWRCPVHKSRKVMVCAGSIFEHSRLALTRCTALLHFWSHGISVKATVGLTGLHENTVILWHKRFREVCTQWLQDNPRQIGGRAGGRRLIVQIDESVVARRKYNRGRWVPQRWIFGGYAPETGEGFVEFVDRRNAATLVPLIVQHIARGSLIRCHVHMMSTNILDYLTPLPQSAFSSNLPY